MQLGNGAQRVRLMNSPTLAVWDFSGAKDPVFTASPILVVLSLRQTVAYIPSE